MPAGPTRPMARVLEDAVLVPALMAAIPAERFR
jgi:hypothetical protein